MGWRDDEGQKISSLARNSEASGRFHTDWLNMMYPRLKLARNLLRADGGVFITIDDHEVASLRAIFDDIFGEENCLAILIWQHSLQPKGYSGTFSVHHNYVICYQKSEDFDLANLERTDEHNKNYSIPDNDPNGAWRAGDVRNALYRPNLIYKITTPSGKTIEPPPNGWRWSRETLDSKIKTGEIIFSSDETRIIRKIYLNSLDGRTPETILFGKEVGTTRDAASEVKSLFNGIAPFDTPKPTGLIRHLITLSGARGDDMVVDFFAGSGTTGHAVVSLNALDSCNRRYILVQLPEPLDSTNKDQKTAADFCDRLGKPSTIAELTKERLRRVAAKVKAENPLFAGDTGFRAFKLDHSNIRAWNPTSTELEASLFDHQEHLLEGRSEADVLYELLLKLGLDLCVPIEQRTIAGRDVHAVGGGVLMTCLTDRIAREEVEPLAQGIIDWHKELLSAAGYASQDKKARETTCVFRDSAFEDDVAKTNLAAILEQHGIQNVRSL